MSPSVVRSGAGRMSGTARLGYRDLRVRPVDLDLSAVGPEGRSRGRRNRRSRLRCDRPSRGYSAAERGRGDRPLDDGGGGSGSRRGRRGVRRGNAVRGRGRPGTDGSGGGGDRASREHVLAVARDVALRQLRRSSDGARLLSVVAERSVAEVDAARVLDHAHVGPQLCRRDRCPPVVEGVTGVDGGGGRGGGDGRSMVGVPQSRVHGARIWETRPGVTAML